MIFTHFAACEWTSLFVNTALIRGILKVAFLGANFEMGLNWRRNTCFFAPVSGIGLVWKNNHIGLLCAPTYLHLMRFFLKVGKMVQLNIEQQRKPQKMKNQDLA